MFKLLILAIAVGAISAATDADWTVFKATHGKLYDGEVDTIRRFIWEENLKKIASHNALYAKGMTSYWLGENEYADMTTAEFVKTMNGYKGQSVASQTLSQGKSLRNLLLPSEVNWVKKGYVTGVKNQGQCGSCWAFSTTGSLEGAHFKKTWKLVSLSEKNLMDCSDAYGNMGCNGGLMDNAFKYVIANKGIDTEKSYPYVPKDGKCKFNRANVGSTEISYTDVQHGSEEALTQASATVGPISVAIDASHASFQLYKGGVYNEPNCSPTQLDHGVLVVGYGKFQGTDYYLVKNSWGTTWGLEGYIMMSRNKNNQCGIATSASYPTV